MGVILIGQWLRSVEGIFKGALAESSRPIPCNLWNIWGNIVIGNL